VVRPSAKSGGCHYCSECAALDRLALSSLGQMGGRDYMNAFTPSFRKFIAALLADLAKAVFAVGLASYFFKEFPPFIRWSLVVFFFVLLILSVLVYPKDKEFKETP
jgi:hypothetical protein